MGLESIIQDNSRLIRNSLLSAFVVLGLSLAGCSKEAPPPAKPVAEEPPAMPVAEEAPAPTLTVDESSFKCISEMTKVRHFFVDNLLGNLDETVAVAEAGTGDYPAGTVLQLLPNEVMIKHPKGVSPATRDWEFFFLDNSAEGSKIYTRGFVEVNNRLGMNCFACHVKARPEFDLVCEEGHGCDPIPITRPMVAAIQKTDPRCKNPEPLTAEDQASLKQFGEILKAMAGQAQPAQAK